jgi:hypothetical protein
MQNSAPEIPIKICPKCSERMNKNQTAIALFYSVDQSSKQTILKKQSDSPQSAWVVKAHHCPQCHFVELWAE